MHTHVTRLSIGTDRAILEVDVVCLEVHVPEERLQRGSRRAGPDQRGVEGGRDEEDGGLGVVHPVIDELIIPDVHQVARGCVPCREGGGGVELSLCLQWSQECPHFRESVY